MKALIIVIMLAGCATQPEVPRSSEYRQCEYQAKVSTQPSGSVLQDVIREGELLRMCLSLKGVTS